MPPTLQALPHCCNFALLDPRAAEFKPRAGLGRSSLRLSGRRSPSSLPRVSPSLSGTRLASAGSSGAGRRLLSGASHAQCSSSRFSHIEAEGRGPGSESSSSDCVDLVEQNVIPKQEEEVQTCLSSSHHRPTRHGFQDIVSNPQWQGAAMKLAGVVGIVGLQACLPAFAESLGLEVARSDQPIGLMTDLGDFQSGFTSAFLLIFFSEIGDKTFFIAALLATRKSNLAVFTGTFGALAAMTVISVTLGRAFHYLDNILPFSLGNTQLPLDDLAAVVLLVYFGVSTLVEAASMEGSKAEEEQQEAELAIAGVGRDGAGGLQAAASTVAATFALVFVAEWGDKSFFSTIALAAASSPAGVVTGAIAGHGVATVLAVLGGSFLGTYVSEKVIAYVGGVLFLVFAAATLVEIAK